MKNAMQNIVSLSEFKKARELVELKDVELFVRLEQEALRDLDQDIAKFLEQSHKLKETEKFRTVLAGINGRVLELADWLEDAPTNTGISSDAATIERLRKTTNQLISRSEITRKVLVDDMANSRYYEQRWLLDPARIIGLVVVGPVSIDTFVEKFSQILHVDNAVKIGNQAGETAVAVGLYLAFKKHADSLAGKAYKGVKKAPANVRKLALASALEMSVRLKSVNEIEPSYPKERPRYERVAVTLKR